MTEREDDVTRQILRHLGLPYARQSKDECDFVITYMSLRAYMPCWNGRTFTAVVDALSLPAKSGILKAQFSLRDTSYHGNMLHHLARDPVACFQPFLPYAVAVLRFLGCDFYNDPDSDGHTACYLLARGVKSRTVFHPVQLLLTYLERRHDEDYEPCDATLTLLNEK